MVYVANHRVTNRERARLGEVLTDRNTAAERAARIEIELKETRARLGAIEPLEREHSEEVDAKDDEIDRLEKNLKRASRSGGRARTRESERIAKRFATLYKTVEIDDRAIDAIAELGDESLRLKAEEAIKRLADDAENVAVRRKVGGLPDRVQVFELGFAGKGRIYYGRGQSRRFRILLVGAKNTQSTDLETLRGMSLDG